MMRKKTGADTSGTNNNQKNGADTSGTNNNQ
jgi:hypothetical protein